VRKDKKSASTAKAAAGFHVNRGSGRKWRQLSNPLTTKNSQ
jgi:hypothetical protein